MTKIGKFLKLMMGLSLSLAMCCCSDDVTAPATGPAGYLEGVGSEKQTVFHISQFPGYSFEGEVTFELVNPKEEFNMEFRGNVVADGKMEVLQTRGALVCRMQIGETEIPDGRYQLTICSGEVRSEPMRLILFRDNIGVQENYVPVDYDGLDGDGTEESPYLIQNAGDFLTFQYWLTEDEMRGSGRYFSITRSFELPARSQVIDGREWLSVGFQGTLDGSNHTLRNLGYIGGSDAQRDSGVGLFSSLFNATVRNLKLKGGVLTGVSSEAGMLAGRCSGNTIVENVETGGTINGSSDNIGGLIGKAEGNLVLRDISLTTTTMIAGEAAGLIIGRFEGETLSISGVTTPESTFSVSGRSNIGGVCGEVNATGDVIFEKINIEHTVDAESSDVRVIYGENSNVGGVVGNLNSEGTVSFNNCTIKSPVMSGGDNAGGMAGNVNAGKMTGIEKVQLASVVKGKRGVGGFFGNLNLGGGTLEFQGNDNDSRYVPRQSAAAGITAESGAGAIAGCVAASGGKILFDCKVEIAVNVSGTEEIGGAIGLYAGADSGSDVFDITGLNFSSETMRVTGDKTDIGGVIGHCQKVTVMGPERNKFNLEQERCAAGYLERTFSGVVAGDDAVGGVVGRMELSAISQVSTSAEVTARHSVSSKDGVGGVVGCGGSELSYCSFSGTVSGKIAVGGIIGHTIGNVEIGNCINYSDISGGGEFLGGIAGRVEYSDEGEMYVHSCLNVGNLSQGNSAGGIIGSYVKGSWKSGEHRTLVENCGNYGDIIGNGDSSHSIGGVIGHAWAPKAKVVGCANHGKVWSQTVQLAIGGVVGTLGEDDYNECHLSECMNSGEVGCDVASTKLGGVVGHLRSGKVSGRSTISDSYNIGNLPSDQKEDTGGILGMATTETDTYRTFNSGKISHGNAIIGTHKSGTTFNHSHNYYLEGTGGSWPSSTSVKKEDIGKESVYGDFDFENVWKITDEGPVLRRCPFQGSL